MKTRPFALVDGVKRSLSDVLQVSFFSRIVSPELSLAASDINQSQIEHICLFFFFTLTELKLMCHKLF